MAEVKCPGCKKPFQRGYGIRAHQRKCHSLKVVAKHRFKKLENNLLERKKAKLARVEDISDKDVSEQRQDLRDDLNNSDSEGSYNDKDYEYQSLSLQPFEVLLKSPSPLPRAFGLPRRKIRLPKKYQDVLPPAPPYIPRDPSESEDVSVDEDSDQTSSTFDNNSFQTEPDSYGVRRTYFHGRPSITPDINHTLSDASDSPYLALTRPVESSTPFYKPFRNPSIFRVMSWFYGSSNTLSLRQLDLLIRDVIQAPDFSTDDLVGFSASKEHALMDSYHETSSMDNSQPSPFNFDDTWIKGSVEIPLPCDGFQQISEAEAPKMKVEFHYCKIIEIIQAAFSEPAAENFHTFPFKSHWKPTPNVEERIYSEVYDGNAWNEEYDKIQATHGDSNIETFIAGLLFWSDATILAQFGTADLWPVYLYLGNQSKYTRVKPSSFSAHHIAYLPKLPDNIQETYMNAFGKPATAAVLTHLRREIAHAVWMLLLDDNFMHAYIHGLLFRVIDGIMRLLFPRFLTYSADYPEKMLMASLKYLLQCPCPRCLLLKSKIPLLGSKIDTRDRIRLARVDDQHRRNAVEKARYLMFKKGVNVTSVKIDRILSPNSLVPTRNAFSERLLEHGFNFYEMFVPDLLHEFELGVWKAVFTHLIRILYAYGQDTIQELNSRYRQVPPFGRDTIRRFSNNASGMKKLAGRDFEDLLQCAIPVFEGLLPLAHDHIIRELLFELATWHALAKLRLHTETTVTDLENSTSRLGKMLRRFKSKLCSEYETYDLPSEEAARGRRKSATSAKKNASEVPKLIQPLLAASNSEPEIDQPKTQPARAARRQHQFNLGTYKTHSLGAYAKAIRQYGPTDNYNSQTGELEHRRGKRHYKRVHKGQRIVGIGRQIRRERLIHRLRERNQRQNHESAITEQGDLPLMSFHEEPLPPTPLEQHHHISVDNRQKVNILQWCARNKTDPALKDFIPRLKNHLLSRLLGLEYDGDELLFSNEDRRSVIIANDTMYQHKVLRINYTTYDLRRAQDSINPRTHPDIMVLSPENEEENEDPYPYWYARILGIYHVNVLHRGPHSKSREPQRMEFLFVRWFGLDRSPQAGWRTKRLFRVGFVPGNDEIAFGFLNPAQVIRAVHLIPAFSWGRVTTLLENSPIARALGGPYDSDWQLYYVSMFSDRDLMMRHRGGGVGHSSTRDATDYFKNDRDKLDIPNSTEEKSHSDDEDEDESDDEDGLKDLSEPEGSLDNGDEEDDYGYNRYHDPDASEDEREGGPEEDDEAGNDSEGEFDINMGPEEDGGAADPDMEDFGYANF